MTSDESTLVAEGAYDVPDSLTDACAMTNEEREEIHPFVFNVKLN